MKTKLLKLGHEVLTVFCEQCKCCLASSTHCGTCHSTKAIEKLCGCGDCLARANDYIEREATKARRRMAYLGMETDEL